MYNKPNIILITADQLRADTVGYINKKIKQPKGNKKLILVKKVLYFLYGHLTAI